MFFIPCYVYCKDSPLLFNLTCLYANTLPCLLQQYYERERGRDLSPYRVNIGSIHSTNSGSLYCSIHGVVRQLFKLPKLKKKPPIVFKKSINMTSVIIGHVAWKYKTEILAISGNLKVEIFMFQFQGDDRIYNVLDDGRRTSLDRVYMCL